MKKFLLILTVFLCLLPLAGCNKQMDYTQYISEKRTNIYLYKDDNADIKIYCSKREQPYLADGIKGEMNDFCEVFVSLPKNPQELDVSIGSLGGEMNYQAVENRYYLAFSAPAFSEAGVEVTLKIDGETTVYTALTVTYEGVLGCDDALNCVIDHEKELFDSKTSGGIFDGEIYVRLLYDEGCYYYVGVCGKDGTINAFLVDGEKGKIIAKKTL